MLDDGTLLLPGPGDRMYLKTHDDKHHYVGGVLLRDGGVFRVSRSFDTQDFGANHRHEQNKVDFFANVLDTKDDFTQQYSDVYNSLMMNDINGTSKRLVDIAVASQPDKYLPQFPQNIPRDYHRGK